MFENLFSTFNIIDSEGINELKIIKEISSGANGKVIEVEKGEKFALKIMHINELSHKNLKDFIKEYEILCMLNHPNIIRSYSIFMSDENKPPSILLEICPNDLHQIITKKNPSKVEIISYIYQIVEGMKYVHKCKLIHRDLKPTNILIGNDGLIRISDFGISKLMTSEEQSMTLGIGTQKFMAPEVLKEEKYNEKVDIYSFGVIVYFMLSGGQMPQINIIQVGNGEKAKIPDNFTPLAKELINNCWNYKPDDRPSFESILSLLEKNKFELFELTEIESKEIQKFVKTHQKLISKIDEDNISPIFLTAIEKFTENRKFAYLCSLIIKNAKNLIVDPQSKLLYNHFNYDSDLVTILDSIYEICTEDVITDISDDCGLNIFTLNSIYSQIEKKFGANKGPKLVYETIKWAKKQNEGLFGIVDKFIKCLDKNGFIENRICEFNYIHNANNESVPLLVYKAKDDQNIEIYRRPGCHGLQSPGNIIVLSLTEDLKNKKKYGMIIHNDITRENDNQGIVSVEINNCSFFFPLFESYIHDYCNSENFINIYKTQIPNKKSSLMIYINNINDKSVLSFCPRNSDVLKKMNESISLINSLMPFVPRSILVRFEELKCTCEIVGHCTGYQISLDIFMDSKEDQNPYIYQINKTTLDFAVSNIDQLKKCIPLIRFALTGENFLYKNSIDNDEDEQEFSYPDVSSSIQNLFDPDHPSHLVLLVEKCLKKTIDSPSFSWQQHDEHKKSKRQDKHLRWNYDETSIPQIDDINDDEKNIACMYICDDDDYHFLPQPIFVYEKDGSTKTMKICKGCVLGIFRSNMEYLKIIDPITKEIDYANLANSDRPGGIFFLIDCCEENDECWPQIPLGQILFTFMCEPNEISDFVKSWVKYTTNYAIYHDYRYFTFCPKHPEIPLTFPKDGLCLKCSKCTMMLCDKCCGWHEMSESCKDQLDLLEDDRIRRCPNCGVPCFRYLSNIRIACVCGKNWCFICKKIFDTAKETYEHIYNEHSDDYNHWS